MDYESLLTDVSASVLPGSRALIASITNERISGRKSDRNGPGQKQVADQATLSRLLTGGMTMKKEFGRDYASVEDTEFFTQIPCTVPLWRRSIRGVCGSRGRQNLSLPGLPETARRADAVGSHLSQA
jgi:hypothetical protein